MESATISYQKEKSWDHKHKGGKRIKDRAERNKARAMVVKAKGKAAVKGKDVDHIKPLVKGGTTSLMNLAAVAPSKNRSFKRTKTGGMA